MIFTVTASGSNSLSDMILLLEEDIKVVSGTDEILNSPKSLFIAIGEKSIRVTIPVS
jgi:hypothetical protein